MTIARSPFGRQAGRGGAISVRREYVLADI
jgi:hypothetical protein